MTVHCLVDNLSRTGLPAEHGLSLLVETDDGTTILFDMGASDLFADNAHRMGLDLGKVQFAVVSHGHRDHGGGLDTFLRHNTTAPVYIRPDAFRARWSYRDSKLNPIGLEANLLSDNSLQGRFVSCHGIVYPAERLTLIFDVDTLSPSPPANRHLFLADGCTPDSVTDEQSLVIEEDNHVVLIAGCAHRGIVNIMRRAEAIVGRPVTHVLAGMHLSRDCDGHYLATLADALRAFPACHYVTFHCTGTDAYERLHTLLGDRISYLSCGETLSIGC